ncbi:HU family DNA-binding protein [Sphaerisporangium viridialbum]|uniref:HU family DNA-binding protein n=1 Tax=Sphaerisporangium viridialbum TaxID=46189 RepID=UPI003C790B0C
MNKAELIEEFGKRTGAASKAAAKRHVQAFIDIIVGEVVGGGEVRIGGLGVFEQVYRKGRKARNPSTGEPIETQGRKAPRFRASNDFKNQVAQQ